MQVVESDAGWTALNWYLGSVQSPARGFEADPTPRGARSYPVFRGRG